MRIEGKAQWYRLFDAHLFLSLFAFSLFDSFIIIFYSADSISVVSETKEKEEKIVLSNGYKGELCQWADRWARVRKNAQQLGKVRVLLSQSVEVYKLRRHSQWQWRDEWVLLPGATNNTTTSGSRWGKVPSLSNWPSEAVNAIRQR